jgi:hypothetical protein
VRLVTPPGQPHFVVGDPHGVKMPTLGPALSDEPTDVNRERPNTPTFG